MTAERFTADEKRRILKAAGWLRSQRASSGEWWYRTSNDPLIRLDSAWRKLRREASEVGGATGGSEDG